jgi:NADH-quinone oxidoreductase subunit J
MPTVEAILFWVFAGITLFSALAVVTCKRIIYSTLSLILVFLSIAAFFVLNNADFLAIAQLIVYAVGLTIILLFGVMFTGEKLETTVGEQPMPRGQQWLFGLVCTLFGALLVAAQQFPYLEKAPSAAIVKTLQSEGSTGLLGKAIFTQFVVPFELASVLLLVAMVGAILIAKKRLDVNEAPPGATRMPLNLSSAPKAMDTPELVLSGVESAR